jgi:anti-sigma factor RsiW
MTCAEAQELITALLDDELDEAGRRPLEMHLQDCADCRVALTQERFLKRQIRAAGDSLRAPASLRDRILADQRIFPEKAQPRSKWRYIWSKPHILRPAALAAFLLVITLTGLYVFNQARQPIALAAVESYGPFIRGELPVSQANSANEIKEKLVRAAGGRFEPMAYDLEAMNLKPVAGAVREIQGRTILIAVYRGEGGSLLCYTFLGSEKDAPLAAASFFDRDKKINFYAFSHHGANAVLHREGDVICILVSEMPMEDLLALAQSKARPS